MGMQVRETLSMILSQAKKTHKVLPWKRQLRNTLPSIGKLKQSATNTKWRNLKQVRTSTRSRQRQIGHKSEGVQSITSLLPTKQMDGVNKNKTSSIQRLWWVRQTLITNLYKQMRMKNGRIITLAIQLVCALSRKRKKESLILLSQRTGTRIRESGCSRIRALAKLSWRNRLNSQNS